MDFTFLRHGASEGNIAHVVQGQRDYPLSALGRRQIQALAAHWKSRGFVFNEILSSPLLRARTCAEILAATFATPLSFDPVWKERDHGEAQGKPYEEVQRWYHSQPQPSPYEPFFESGESEWDLFQRAMDAAQGLVRKPSGSYLIVSHGGMLSAVIRVILGAMPTSGRQPPIRISHANTGYSRLSYDVTSGRWTVHSINVTCHLREDEEA
jgi:broad specificity phosphatase PhoE